MTDATKKRIITALRASLADATDSLAQTRYSFRGADLSEQFGDSGMTRAEILAAYEKEEREACAALNEATKELLP